MKNIDLPEIVILRQNYLDKGNTLLQSNNYHEALKQFEKAKSLIKEIDKETRSQEIFSNKIANMFGNAKKIFISGDKELHRIKILEGISWTKARMGNYVESLKDCNELISFAIIEKVLLQKFFTVRACCYNELGNSILAERSFEIANINPLLIDQIIDEEGDESIGLTALGYNAMGNRYFKHQKFQDALDNYSNSIKINSNYAMAYYNKGVVFSEIKDHVSAIEAYSKCISIESNYTDAYLNRANEYCSTYNFKSAIDDYNECLRIDPNNKLASENKNYAKSML